jgi:hypothetical protein
VLNAAFSTFRERGFDLAAGLAFGAEHFCAAHL